MKNRGLVYLLAALVAVLTIALAFTVPALLETKSRAVCEAVNENRALIRFVAGEAPVAYPIPVDADPSLAETIREANRRQAAIYKRVQRTTAPIGC